MVDHSRGWEYVDSNWNAKWSVKQYKGALKKWSLKTSGSNQVTGIELQVKLSVKLSVCGTSWWSSCLRCAVSERHLIFLVRIKMDLQEPPHFKLSFTFIKDRWGGCIDAAWLDCLAGSSLRSKLDSKAESKFRERVKQALNDASNAFARQLRNLPSYPGMRLELVGSDLQLLVWPHLFSAYQDREFFKAMTSNRDWKDGRITCSESLLLRVAETGWKQTFDREVVEPMSRDCVGVEVAAITSELVLAEYEAPFIRLSGKAVGRAKGHFKSVTTYISLTVTPYLQGGNVLRLSCDGSVNIAAEMQEECVAANVFTGFITGFFGGLIGVLAGGPIGFVAGAAYGADCGVVAHQVEKGMMDTYAYEEEREHNVNLHEVLEKINAERLPLPINGWTEACMFPGFRGAGLKFDFDLDNIL